MGKMSLKKVTSKHLSSLSEGEQRYCRCILKVAQKQPDECLRNKSWGRGTGCYNPYAVCTKSVGHQARHCYYDYSLLSDSLIRVWFSIHDKVAPSPWDRDIAIAIIENYSNKF